MKNNELEQLLKKDIKTCIITTINKELNLCLGLVINPLYNFTVKDITFIVHNEFKISLFYNKDNNIVVKIKEDEKIKVLSEFSTGSYCDFSKIDISISDLVPFNGLIAGLHFYYKIIKIIQENDVSSISKRMNEFTEVINNYKKINSYFVFNISKG